MVKIKVDLELFGRSVKQSLTLNLAFGFIFIHAFTWVDFGVGYEVVPKSVRDLCEILTIETDVQHEERVFMVEVWNVGSFAGDSFILIDSFHADPVLAVLCSWLLFFFFFF